MFPATRRHRVAVSLEPLLPAGTGRLDGPAPLEPVSRASAGAPGVALIRHHLHESGAAGGAGCRVGGGTGETGHVPYAAAFVRDAPAPGRLRYPDGAGAPGTPGRGDDDDLYARTESRGVRRAESGGSAVRSPWVELPYCRAMGSCDAGDVSGIRCNARVTGDREAFASGCALGWRGWDEGRTGRFLVIQCSYGLNICHEDACSLLIVRRTPRASRLAGTLAGEGPEATRVEHRDRRAGPEHQQVLVAGDQHIGLPRDGTRKDPGVGPVPHLDL